MPKYNSINTIPAVVFFEILKTKNYQLLKPKPKEQDLEQVFISIYDEFFLKSDNVESKRYLDITKEICFLEYKIVTLKQSLHFYYFNQTTKEMREDFAKALKQGFKIYLDLSKPFAEEVKRILEIEIGIIENDLSQAKIEFEEMIKISKGKDFDYYDAIVGIANVLQGNSLINDKMSLATYISLEKSAKKAIELQNKKVA